MLNRYLGCLFGLAIGDALGAPVEFLSLSQIGKTYGENGITGFQGWSGFQPGSYTDDTQMSLATAWGCLDFKKRLNRGETVEPSLIVYRYYLDWLKSQNDPYQRRAPGNTCLSALQSGKMGSVAKRINNSKGCGGVMRTAPAGLSFPPWDAFKWGAEFAAITHGHPSGYLPAGFLSELIAWIISGKPLPEAIDLTMQELVKYEDFEETLDKVRTALKLAGANRPVADSIRALGEGWVGEEALAVSLYCSLVYPDHWREGVLAALNHTGDSDSTGSITGAILGASLGIEAIPAQWVGDVENPEAIEKTATDMFNLFAIAQSLS
ncbi:MAG: ADP-ribosylglycohydrolase family protein [Deltaproteobacteria bacterium]|nr:ADP-ribosylglycohydrolase family protein [Deltaproteobacteria bacterium]